MMKKVIKKLLAALLAVAMLCAMAIPAFAYESWETEEDLNKNHGYIAFQIFKGVISKDNPTLSGVDWGKHIIDHDAFLEKLRKADRIGPLFANANSVPDVLAVSANGMIPMMTASLSRVLYATISTRMVQPRTPTL